MKPIIIDIEEMSDSTEVYGTQPSRVFSGIIYTLAALFVFCGCVDVLFSDGCSNTCKWGGTEQ